MTNLQKLITNAWNYDMVFVTGGQRSGTQIAAKILAHETGYVFVHEKEYGVHYMGKMWDRVKEIGKPVVVHSPALFHRLPIVAEDKTIMKVFVLRDLKEIQASIDRINWKENDVELQKIKQTWGKMYEEGTMSAKAKLDIFSKEYLIQHDHHYILNYDDLKGHSLFVNKENRKGWDAWRTE